MQTKNKNNIENKIMDKILSGEIKMKPKWYFVLGSFLSFVGLMGSIIGAVFFANLTLFLIRKRGPGIGRINMMLDSFPIWIPVIAVILIILGLLLLKKYDFSYKKNFLFIVALLLAAILFSALIIDKSGLNDIWSKRGPMNKLYPEHRIDTIQPHSRPRNDKSF